MASKSATGVTEPTESEGGVAVFPCPAPDDDDDDDEEDDDEDDADDDGNLDGFVVPDKSESDEDSSDGEPPVPSKTKRAVTKRPGPSVRK